MTSLSEQTLASIVTGHYQAVPVLEKYDLDFCCKGKRTLADACNEKGLFLDEIMKEVEASFNMPGSNSMPYNEMNAEQLISYILIHHHFYVKQSMPTIIDHIIKVATKHGERYPYMIEVLHFFKLIQEEMTLHMRKEEEILFPRIKEVAALYENKEQRHLPEGYIGAPTANMMREHDEAGEILQKIKKLTNNYTPPEEACTTFRITLEELKGFEEDLHKHVHLENNLLFPKAEKMMQAVILN